MTLNDYDKAIEALGRPRICWAPPAAFRASQDAISRWQASNPEAHEEWMRLSEERAALAERVEREEAEQLRIERALRRSGDRLATSGVGPRSLEAAQSPEDTEALGAVKRWLGDATRTWLVLCGEKGTGKTVAATWAVAQAIRTGSGAAFRRVSEVAKLGGFDVGARECEYLKRVSLLVLDDFGAETLTEWARSQLHELLDYRHEFYARTIITSNLAWHPTKADGQGLVGRLGGRLEDRIRQAGTVVQLRGPSRRSGR